MINLRGLGVALVTPFTESGSVDFAALEGLVNHVIDGGVDFLVVFGTTAEPPTLTSSEKKEILSLIKSINKNRLPIVLGMGGNNTSALIEEIKSTDFEGISALLSVTPYYNKPTQNGMYAHYKALDEVSPLPIILYNVPPRTGVNLLPSTVLRLANECKNIVAIKEASGSIAQAVAIIKDAPEDFFVLSGDDNQIIPLIAVGGDGVISVAANAFPSDCSALVKAALDENLVVARSKMFKLASVTEMLFEEGNPAGVKCALAIKNIASNHVRLPLVAASEQLEAKMRDEIEKYKL